MQTAASTSGAGPSNSGTLKYVVQTSDVLSDMRVNVSEEGSSTVIWYKERFLSDNEIIENVVHNPTSTILWTIHRPSSRGWYIRIRSPAFPPGVFIPLIPVPSTSPLHSDAALSFNTRTNVVVAPPPPAPSTSSLSSLPTSESQFALHEEEEEGQGMGKDGVAESESDIGTERMSEASSSTSTPSSTSASASGRVSTPASSIHSYPPTPIATSPSTSFSSPSSSKSPASYFDGPTPTRASFTNPKTHKRPLRPNSSSSFGSGNVRPSSQISQFLLSPTSVPPASQRQQQSDSASLGFFARALSVLKSHRPSHSNSFTLSRVLSSPAGSNTGRNGTATPPPPYASNISLASSLASATSTVHLNPNPHPQPTATPTPEPELHTPLLTFHDQTPVYTVRSLTGLIELDKAEMMDLGVDPAFWISVALTYLEFLEERESYLAALSD